MTKRDSSRVALVTGGGQGIGKGIAQCLVGEGMHVVIADIDAEAAEEAAAELGSCTAVTVDVTDEGAVARAVDLVSSRLGRLDVLVNNAGIAAPLASPVEQLELADWNRPSREDNLPGAALSGHRD